MYETLINSYNNCKQKALLYYNKGDFILADFYNNAASGYKNKAKNLLIMEVSEK